MFLDVVENAAMVLGSVARPMVQNGALGHLYSPQLDPGWDRALIGVLPQPGRARASIVTLRWAGILTTMIPACLGCGLE